MGAGLSNLISDMGTTDIPDGWEGHMGGPFWEQMETFEKNSPIYHVEGVSTPTQVLHGTEDERVHPTQGREFYRALRRQGVPTEMVLYPRMPHGPREPKQAIDIMERPLNWLDEHLGRSEGEDSPQ
jgi:dipeptidyl aminopeptidase/acylaminoacyl peptidase